MPDDVKFVLERELKNYPLPMIQRDNEIPGKSVLTMECDLEVDFCLAQHLLEKCKDANTPLDDFDPRKHRLKNGIRK